MNQPVKPSTAPAEPLLDDDEAEFEAEVEALSNSPKFQKIMAKSRQSLKEKGGIPLDDVMREFGIE